MIHALESATIYPCMPITVRFGRHRVTSFWAPFVVWFGILTENRTRCRSYHDIATISSSVKSILENFNKVLVRCFRFSVRNFQFCILFLKEPICPLERTENLFLCGEFLVANCRFLFLEFWKSGTFFYCFTHWLRTKTNTVALCCELDLKNA